MKKEEKRQGPRSESTAGLLFLPIDEAYAWKAEQQEETWEGMRAGGTCPDSFDGCCSTGPLLKGLGGTVEGGVFHAVCLKGQHDQNNW